MADDARLLVRLAAALGRSVTRPEKARLLDTMDDVLRDGDPEAAEEVLLQSYLFLGYPAALNAFMLWRKRSGRPAPEPSDADWTAWERRGVKVCSEVYDGQYEQLRRAVGQLHGDLDRWAVAEGYGKVLGRDGLDLVRRELCIVAMLAPLAAPRQLYAHLRGALNVGAAPADVEQALEWIRDLLPRDRHRDAWKVWRKVQERHVKAKGESGGDHVR
ncbi:MAG: carboxymuconolactone decarboxylase family protein [Gemmatimonadota bacterium]|jgi:4-carboxymuconolactone decarboxylase